MLQPVSLQLPYFTNVITSADGLQRVVQQPVLPSYQSAYMFNSLAPSVVYEPKLTGSVFPNHLPVLPIVQAQPSGCQKCCTSANCRDDSERRINVAIDRRVREQINQYNAELMAPKCPTESSCQSSTCFEAPKSECSSLHVDKCVTGMKKLSCCDGQSHEPVNNCKKCPYDQPKCLNLDEKIDLIRHELNLPGEKDQNRLIAKLDAEKKRQEQMGFFTDDRSECAQYMASQESTSARRSRRRSLGDETCSRFRSRSRTFDERSREASEARARSRSASRGGRTNVKPIWLPTGNNDFTRTVELRNKMVVQQEKRQYMLDSLDTLNRNKVFDKPQKVSTNFPSLNRNPRFLNSFETEKPRPTKSRTPESFDYSTNTQAEVQQPTTTYIRATYAPAPEKRTETTTYSYSRPATSVGYTTKQPMYYESTAYPLAKEYYYTQPKTNDLSCYNLRPVASTKGGAIYTCSNKNELHYVTDKARNSVQICTSNNGYSRKADNRTRVIKSDTTVIHD